MDDRQSIAGVESLAADSRFPHFVTEMCELHAVAVDVLSLEGVKVAGWGDGAPAGGKEFTDHEFPLHTWNRGVGYVRVRGAGKGRSDARDVARLVAMVAEGILDSEYQFGSLAEEISEKYEEVNLLYDLSDQFAALFDEKKIGETLLDRLESILTFRCGSVLLYDGKRCTPLAIKSPQGGCCDRCRYSAGDPDQEGFLAEVIRSRRAMIVTEEKPPEENFLRDAGEEKIESVLAVPLLRSSSVEADGVVGAIVLTKRDRAPFTSGEEKLVSAVASQASTAIANARLVEELKKAARMKRDLELAREIQASLLPEEAPVVEGVDLAGRCATADNVGGDYYGYVVREDRSVSVLIGDVTGHNLGAALIMTTARATLLASASDSDNPGVVLERANRLLYRDLTASSLLISLFAARLGLRNRRLLFANGGHNTPVLYRKETGLVETLDAEGLILGVQEDVEYEVGMRDLAPGDVVLFYTDGIVEARSPSGMLFGTERLGKALAERAEFGAKRIADGLYDDIMAFIDGAKVKDDITMVVMKVTE
ncbi:MAG: PP2C family protein-serine/threonine phosphatase [Candidatus Eisenbacteria bacterium]